MLVRLSALLLALTVCACGGDSGEGGPADGGVQAGGSSGGGSGVPAPVTSADKGMVAYLEGFEAMTAALKNVKDEASAKAAGDKIRDIAAKLTEKGEELEGLSEAEIAAAGARYSSQLQKAQMDLSQAMMPVAMNPAYAQHLSDALKALPQLPAK